MSKTIRIQGISSPLRQIPAYPAYWATKDGRIYRLGRAGKPKKLPSPLKPRIMRTGYLVTMLSLGKARKVKLCRLHILIAAAWMKPAGPGRQLHHKDENKANCAVSNLTYLTYRNHQLRHGIKLLTARDVRAIRKSKLTYRALAEKYGRTEVAIFFIRSGRTYKHVK